jgi:hypothetical protein
MGKPLVVRIIRGAKERGARMYDESDFSIKYNETKTNVPCLLCRQDTDPDVGPELFYDDIYTDTPELVCYECGAKYASHLLDCLVVYHSTVPIRDDPLYKELVDSALHRELEDLRAQIEEHRGDDEGT